MSIPSKRIPPALKHAGFSSTSVLPGEDATEFEKLRQGIVAELELDGALENKTGDSLARLLWRRENLAIFGVAQRAQRRMGQIRDTLLPRLNSDAETSGVAEFEGIFQKKWQAAEAKAREEFGEHYDLVELGDDATLESLAKQLAILDRLDSMIDRCLKRLLLIRGLKSLPPAPVHRERLL
jgi:hypothetical protein